MCGCLCSLASFLFMCVHACIHLVHVHICVCLLIFLYMCVFPYIFCSSVCMCVLAYIFSAFIFINAVQVCLHDYM